MVKKELSTAQRNNIVQFLLGSSKDGKPQRGKMQEASITFQISYRTVQRLWAAAANSPDMNINDLGWFRAIQAIQHESVCYTTKDLVIAVQESFEKLEDAKLNKVFLTLQSCMLEVMKVKGGNNYKIPHTKKDYLDRRGLLPITLEAAKDLVQESVDFLIEHGEMNGLEELIEQLGVEEDDADARV